MIFLTIPAQDLAVRDIAQELIQIADQLENSVMARETDSLLRTLQRSKKQVSRLWY